MQCSDDFTLNIYSLFDAQFKKTSSKLYFFESPNISYFAPINLDAPMEKKISFHQQM
jgi:hypothetical protein